MEPRERWPLGSFNQCVLVDTHEVAVDTVGSHVLLRVPMAHRLTGMVDEKMRCEVATYIWIHENCPDIPIPRLYAFGFPDGRHVGSLSLFPSDTAFFQEPNTRVVHPRKPPAVVPEMDEIPPKANLHLARTACPVILCREPMGS